MAPFCEALLFDLDDTLLASTEALGRALAAAESMCCAASGIQPDEYRSANRAVTSRLFAEVEAGRLRFAEARGRIWAETLEAVGRPDPALAREIEYHFGQTQLRELRMFDDAAEVLCALQGRVPMGLVTNGAADRHPESQRSKVDFFGLERYLSPVVISDAVGVRKPHRGIFEAALAALKVPTERVIFVGDNLQADIGGANGAGLISVWLDRHHQPPGAFPEGARPAHIVSTLADLPRLVGL